MKAITIRQPWASLIAEGVKTIETRAKPHPWRSAIGETIAIHSARKFAASWGELTVGPIGDTGWWLIYDDREGGFFVEQPHGERVVLGDGPRVGTVLAVCTLVDVVPITSHDDDRTLPRGDRIAEFVHEGDLPHQRGGLWITGPRVGTPTRIEEQRPFGDFSVGRYALLLDRVERLREPFPCSGRQGLWTLEPNVESMITKREQCPVMFEKLYEGRG